MRIGTDIIEIERIQAAYDRHPHFSNRVLSPSESFLFASMPYPRQIEFLAGRFCVKEAYVKALGTGLGRIQMKQISIGYHKNGQPYLQEGPLTQGVQVSISHSRNYATATVLIESTEQVINEALAKYFAKLN
ncbi:holo-ACP synthase [Vaginisenegalia massiliensis]|uniref:holo-ACP synthase n=1 Tax=Vaginisenegalia massiliensis TaxID=2058294 RepID=UPI001F14C616|nr:holo-ACP synthase [Vaginisenegalia massiliensis]